MPNDNPVEAAATTLAELYIKYANLKNHMEREDDFSCSEDIISRACAIDVECAEWALTIPVDYVYRTVTVKNRGVEVFAEHYHIYNNLWIAMIVSGISYYYIIFSSLLHLAEKILYHPSFTQTINI